jgi:hypothetical protein
MVNDSYANIFLALLFTKLKEFHTRTLLGPSCYSLELLTTSYNLLILCIVINYIKAQVFCSHLDEAVSHSDELINIFKKNSFRFMLQQIYSLQFVFN